MLFKLTKMFGKSLKVCLFSDAQSWGEGGGGGNSYQQEKTAVELAFFAFAKMRKKFPR
jgi:hypothetical protein